MPFRYWKASVSIVVAILVVTAAACGDNPPNIGATAEAQTAAKLDEQTAIDADVQVTVEAILTLTPTVTRTPTPTHTPTSSPTPTATFTPTITPSPLPSPTVTPTSEPSATQTTERNSAAPIALTRYLSGDFTDSEGDGMTDVAEKKYGFDPLDAFSFPQEP